MIASIIIYFLLFILVIGIISKVSVVLSITKCVSNVSMSGKVVIVTGANSGIGFEAAAELARRGARVLLACRSEARAQAACAAIRARYARADVQYKHLDLASLASVRRFAEDILSTEHRLDVLVNNAAVYGCGDAITVDGNVEDMQVNYFAPFLLTLLLLPLLSKTRPSRIVNVGSGMHMFGRVNVNHINEVGYYSDLGKYSNSKLCIMLSTKELARRLSGSGITVNVVHPGVIMTNIASQTNGWGQIIFNILCWMASRSVEDGAQTIVYLSVAEECANVSGKFFVDCKERFVPYRFNFKQLSAKLWAFSEKTVGFNNDLGTKYLK